MKKVEELIRNEIKGVVGCTEPASIAFAFSSAAKNFRRRFGDFNFKKIKCRLVVSDEVFRNASTVKVPVLKKKGVLPAAALGLFSESDSFNPFSSINGEVRKKAESLLLRSGWLKIKKLGERGIYVDAEIVFGKNSLRVLIEGEHDKIKKMWANGKIIYRKTLQPLQKIRGLGEIAEIVRKRDKNLECLAEDFIRKQGGLFEKFKFAHSLAAVEGLVEKRMEGEAVEIQTITGSGNQGIFIAIPFYEIYRKEGKKVLPAVLFSILTQIYLTQREGRISHLCGLANKAAPSLAAGLAYHRGKSLKEIKKIMTLTEEPLKGIVCEGAKKSCALKAFICLSVVYKNLSMKLRA